MFFLSFSFRIKRKTEQQTNYLSCYTIVNQIYIRKIKNSFRANKTRFYIVDVHNFSYEVKHSRQRLTIYNKKHI